MAGGHQGQRYRRLAGDVPVGQDQLNADASVLAGPHGQRDIHNQVHGALFWPVVEIDASRSAVQEAWRNLAPQAFSFSVRRVSWGKSDASTSGLKTCRPASSSRSRKSCMSDWRMNVST